MLIIIIEQIPIDEASKWQLSPQSDSLQPLPRGGEIELQCIKGSIV